MPQAPRASNAPAKGGGFGTSSSTSTRGGIPPARAARRRSSTVAGLVDRWVEEGRLPDHLRAVPKPDGT